MSQSPPRTLTINIMARRKSSGSFMICSKVKEEMGNISDGILLLALIESDTTASNNFDTTASNAQANATIQ